MTALLTTTSVTIEAASTPEPFETTTYTTRASGVAAHISSPSGRERVGDAGGERIDAVLLCATTTVERGDRVTDAATGDEFRVAWVLDRTGLGLDHTKAGLVRTTGAVTA